MLFLGYTLGKRIRHFRQKAGLTQKELAERVGISEPALRNYELDNRYPSRDVLTVIADALKVSYYALETPDLSEINMAAHILFEMEELYQLKPEIIDDQVVLRFDAERLRALMGYGIFEEEDENKLTEEEEKELDEILKEVPAPTSAMLLEDRIEAWCSAREGYLEGDIDKETYEDWKMKYPSFAGFDDDGYAVVFDENRSLVEIDLPEDVLD